MSRKHKRPVPRDRPLFFVARLGRTPAPAKPPSSPTRRTHLFLAPEQNSEPFQFEPKRMSDARTRRYGVWDLRLMKALQHLPLHLPVYAAASVCVPIRNGRRTRRASTPAGKGAAAEQRSSGTAGGCGGRGQGSAEADRPDRRMLPGAALSMPATHPTGHKCQWLANSGSETSRPRGLLL
jgi:hypothetical protein